jgi:hypothetical protein
MGADFSPLSLGDSDFAAVLPGVGVCGLGALAAAGFAAADFGTDLVGFTATLGKTGFGVAFVAARTVFFGATNFGVAVAFFAGALPGFLADLFGFFEGILVSVLQTKERAIIPTLPPLYRS